MGRISKSSRFPSTQRGTISAHVQELSRQHSSNHTADDSQSKFTASTLFTTACAATLTGLYLVGRWLGPSFTPSVTHSLASDGSILSTSVAQSALSSCCSAASTVLKWGTKITIFGTCAGGVIARVSEYRAQQEEEERARYERSARGRTERVAKSLGRRLFSSKRSRSGLGGIGPDLPGDSGSASGGWSLDLSGI